MRAKASLCLALGILCAPFGAFAQNTVFNDSFSSDTLNGATYPTVTQTATGWNVASSKNAPVPVESNGTLTINMVGTTAGFIETQALFAAAPVKLLPNTQIELKFTFVPTYILTNSSDNLVVGLFNSGGSAPATGMLNSKLSSSSSDFSTGGAKGWLGYNANIALTGATAKMLTRPAQTASNNTVQDLLFSGQSSSTGYATAATLASTSTPSTTLTSGSTYTLDYVLALSSDSTTLTATCSIYNGTGTSGTGANTLIKTYSATASAANLLTTSFDALAIGWRADAGGSNPSNLLLNSLAVTTTGGAPWFSTEPASSLGGSVGSAVTISTTVGGVVDTYQWQYSSDGTTYANISAGSNSSAGTATLSLSSVQSSDSGYYRLMVTNSAGSTTSTVSNLSITSGAVAPTIVNAPTASTLLIGGSYTLNVNANGTGPLSYQWSKSSDGSTFTAISGATSASYAISSAALTDEGFYEVTVTNTAGNITSTPVKLTVNQSLAISTQPVGATLKVGDSYTLSVTATGKPAPTFQWYLNGTALAGATGSSYVISSATGANAGEYDVIASNTANDSVTSSSVAVAVVSSSFTPTAVTPTTSASGILPDTRLSLTFSGPVSIGASGQIRIYDASNTATPVDTIDIAAGNSLMKTLRGGSTISTLALPVQTKSIGGLTNFDYYPITLSGNTATIYPRNGVLTYGKSYYVVVDPGVFTDGTGLSWTGYSANTDWTFSTKASGPDSAATTLTVAADGSGDFFTVQAALDFIPAGNSTPRTIFIRKGTYFEEVYFTGKHFISFLGEDRAGSVIVYPNNNTFNNASGTYHRMVLQGDHVNNVTFANLTIQNSTPKGGSQAEALTLNGTTTAQAIVTGVNLVSYQDTLLVNGQAYVSNCHISGDVDYMWGTGPVFFENCELTALTSSGSFTQIRNASSNHGYVYLNCTLDGASSVTGMYLARIDPSVSAGFPYSEVVWLNCVMGSAGYTPVGGPGWLLNNTTDQSAASAPNVHFWEYNSHYADGTPIDVSSRIGASKQLVTANDSTTITNYSTPSYVLGGWTPTMAPIIAAQPVAQTVTSGDALTLSVQAAAVPAVTYQWMFNGSAISGATSSTYTVPSSGSSNAGSYSVVVSSGGTNVTSTSVQVTVQSAPPRIALDPTTTSALAGTTATFSVWARSGSAITYQWNKNGASITGATGRFLRLTNVQASDAGNYSVTVTSTSGSATSASAALTVVAPATTLPTQPVIPSGTFDVTAYGAVGDGATDNTSAIQSALNAATTAGGGTVEIPAAASAYLCGPITISSNTNLLVEGGATLQALPFGTYPKSTTSPSHFITIATSATNVEFSGSGTIDGNGAAWWSAYNANTISNRPRLVQINKSGSLLFSGLTLQNSPMFHLAFSGTNTNVTIYGVTISAPGTSPNTDGMDLSGSNFLVQGCSVSVGDDNVVAKPGSSFCSNLYIAQCSFGTGHGCSVGGQSNIGLDGMTVTDCSFNGTGVGIRLKADATQGGPVKNIVYNNLTMTNVAYPIVFYSYYNQLGSPGATSGSSQITPTKVNAWNTTPPNPLSASTIPSWQNIQVNNLTATGATGYSTIWGLPLANGLIANVTLNNVSISGGAGLELYDATNVQLTGSTSVGPVVTCNALGITGQPASQDADEGDTVSFAVTAVGASGTGNLPSTYVWTFKGQPLSDGTLSDGAVVSGSATATLTIAGVTASEAGAFACRVSNQLDGYDTNANALAAASLPVSATSASATLTVNPAISAPTITDQPEDQSTLVGGTAVFSVTASGKPAPTFQWRKNGVAISGATSASLSLSSVQTGDAGSYDVVVTNTIGSISSRLVRLLVTSSVQAPAIMRQPVSLRVVSGQSATFSVAALSDGSATYQWYKDTVALSGATSATLTLPAVQLSSSGVYTVVITDSAGQVTSQEATLSVFGNDYAGTYFGTIGTGGMFALTVDHTNTGSFLGALSDGTTAIVKAKVFVNDDGSFQFEPANQLDASSATDGSRLQPAVATSLTVAGVIAGNGQVTGTVSGTASSTLSGTASAAGSTASLAGFYQTRSSATDTQVDLVADSNGKVLLVMVTSSGVSANLGTVDPTGSVSVTLAGSQTVSGTLTPTTGTAVVTVNSATGSGTTLSGGNSVLLQSQRVIGISSRSFCGTGAEAAIAGFAISGDEAKPVLIRAVGPTLSQYGITSPVAKPKLELYDGNQTLIASNTVWGTASNAAEIAAAASRSGDFALPSGSADSAIFTTLQPGLYTANATPVDGVSGIVLIEVYDLSSTSSLARVVSLSSRAKVGTDQAAGVAGFVVSGSVPKQFIVRGVGPTLANFGVPGALAHPVLKIYQGSKLVAQNSSWSANSNAAQLAAVSSKMGAFGLGSSSDTAMLITLDPGAYTAQVSSADGTTGIALIEVYEVR